MRLVSYHWDHPALKKYHGKADEGAELFRQGEVGKTLFIILQGLVGLFSKRGTNESFVDFVQAGEFMGEKAVMSSDPHERVFTARAKTPLAFVELGLKDIEELSQKEPELVTDLLKDMFQNAAKRLDRANQVISCLRPTQKFERLIHFILMLAKNSDPPNEVFLSLEKLQYYIDISQAEMDDCLTFLQKKNLLFPKASGTFLVKDAKALRAQSAEIATVLTTLK